MGFRWVLWNLFSQFQHDTRYKPYLTCQILLCWILFAFRYKKKLASLINNIRVLLKSVLIDLHACNFVREKPCVHVACMLITVSANCWALLCLWEISVIFDVMLSTAKVKYSLFSELDECISLIFIFCVWQKNLPFCGDL